MCKPCSRRNRASISRSKLVQKSTAMVDKASHISDSTYTEHRRFRNLQYLYLNQSAKVVAAASKTYMEYTIPSRHNNSTC